jgi:acyl-CoA dehydrogenase
MADQTFLNWPFFDQDHRVLAEELDLWASRELSSIDHDDIDQACRDLVLALGKGGWLRHATIGPKAAAPLDVRRFCLCNAGSGNRCYFPLWQC